MVRDKGFYWDLFVATLQLSAFTVGGGFVIVPLMRRKFIREKQWLDEDEMLDLTAIAQSAPGSIAINASILLGYGVAAIMFDVVITMGKNVLSRKRVMPWIILTGSFAAVFFFDVNVFVVIMVCGAVGVADTLYGERLRKIRLGKMQAFRRRREEERKREEDA